MRSLLSNSLLILLAASIGCQSESANPQALHLPASSSANSELKPLNVAALPNAIQVNDKVISGGQPDGMAGFKALSELGVKTIITVDGAQPDVESAREHGLRYVHLPHGYDGISRSHSRVLAKAIVELEGPIYIHCHHGKHRSPAATAVACIGTGMLSAEQGAELLALAGTNPNYDGLYQSVAAAERLSATELDRIEVDYVSRATVPPLAETMVELSHHFEYLAQLQSNQWQAPADHADLAADHESLILQEHFTEMLRPELLAHDAPEYRTMVERSLALSTALHRLLAGGIPTDEEDLSQTAKLMKNIKLECKKCHQQFRD